MLAILVRDCAGSFAGRLARSLAFAAVDVLFVKISGENCFDMHVISPFQIMCSASLKVLRRTSCADPSKIPESRKKLPIVISR